MAALIDNRRRALREVRHRPVFAAAVVLTLAIGIGATTAAFALARAFVHQVREIYRPRERGRGQAFSGE